MYRNTSEILMSDDDYDRGLEELRRRSPQHPFLKVVGDSAAGAGGVLLPYVMGSLNKVRAGEEGLARFVRRWPGVADFVVSEKLDGLSALLVLGISSGGEPKLYLQGDGVRGVDVSRSARLIAGVRARVGASKGADAGRILVRGELLLPNADTPAGSIGRSLVNGWMHRSLDTSKPLPEELRKVRFVAYSVQEPAGLTRSQQMRWLADAGFEIPFVRMVSRDRVKEEDMVADLMRMRADSKYPLDGIVIGTDTVPETLGGGEDKNPTDACAFKAALEEQKAETRIVGIEWNASRQGFLIPRIQIEPVVIGGATIQWLSGHNAKAVSEGVLGTGARIVIRRSGDVIPTLDTVLEAAPGGSELPGGHGRDWDWDATRTHAVVARGQGGAAAEGAPAILHGLQTLGVEGIGPGLVKKLVETRLDTMKKVWDAGPEELARHLGAGRGPAFHTGLREAVGRAGPLELLVASNRLPRGVGEKKLRSLFAVEPDVERWKPARFGCDVPAGWSASSLAEFWQAFAEARAWLRELGWAAAKPTASASAIVSHGESVMRPASFPAPGGKLIVFTNCRDKTLEARLQAAGWEIQDAVTKKTTVVVVPDGNQRETGKVAKARALGIRIVSLSEMGREVV